MPHTERYDRVAVWLHWGVAAAVVTQFATGWVWGYFERGSEPRLYLFRTHIVVGSAILALACARIFWRLTHPAPALPRDIGMLTALAAKVTHGLLYLAILIQPLLGLVAITAIGKTIGRWPRDLHVTLSFIIAGIVALHVAAALWHHFVRRDSLLSCMSPRRRSTGFSRPA